MNGASNGPDYTSQTEAPQLAETQPISNSPTEPPVSSARRAEVLRHVFPRPARGPSPVLSKETSPVANPGQRRGPLSSITYAKSRFALQKVITSIFANSLPRASPPLTRADSSSSVMSKAGSLPDSLRSLDIVSPGMFLFSEPSLKSTYSGSFNNSRSRLPSFSEYDNELFPLHRVNSASLSIDSFTIIEDRVLEPSVECGITRSMSDVLLGIQTPIEEIEDELFPNNPEVPLAPVQLHDLPRNPSNDVILAIAALFSPYLNFSSWKALRLTSRTWYYMLNITKPPTFPPSYRLPVEILQLIYKHLHPKDFNAARHSCRNWMIASLDKPLLLCMLRRGGWSSGVENVLEAEKPSGDTTCNEWLLSRCLSRECALSPKWTGNGLRSPQEMPIVEIAKTDFSDLSNGHSGGETRKHAGLMFTASTCGNILLVARDNIIYVYDLRDNNMLPLTSVVCPRRVLSMSMDITSGRKAVAALLEGRLGVVCELRFDGRRRQQSAKVHARPRSCRRQTDSKSPERRSRESHFGSDKNTARQRIKTATRSKDQYSSTDFTSVDVQADYEAISLQGTNDERMYDRNWINHSWNLTLQGQCHEKEVIDQDCSESCARLIPAEHRTSTFYRHICSEDDPPRSVSICPQRRCVAFGCSAGIELHWVDALTGQSLTRWFPLTAPSDHLYFLPPRPGFESAKKLRLISSAAHPDDGSTISRKFLLSRPILRTFWSSRSGMSGYDHYRAVPLSDGHHVLFIDPPSGRLFLGCDAPFGGPTKLLRKVQLLPPSESVLPRFYAATTDLTWGARIAVAYGDSVILYSIPPDVLSLSRLEQKAESWDIYDSPPFSLEGRAEDYWLNWWGEPDDATFSAHTLSWPISIQGIEVGHSKGICELAVQTNPDLTVWAFTLHAQATTWRIKGESGPTNPHKRHVCNGGMVHPSQMADDDVDTMASC